MLSSVLFVRKQELIAFSYNRAAVISASSGQCVSVITEHSGLVQRGGWSSYGNEI